jgi:hypothetical protein
MERPFEIRYLCRDDIAGIVATAGGARGTVALKNGTRVMQSIKQDNALHCWQWITAFL